MTQETTKNPRNDPTMSAEEYVQKLSSTGLADNSFVSSDVENCINNIRRKKKMLKKHRNNLSKVQKDC